MKKLLCVLMFGMMFGQNAHLEIKNVNLNAGTLDIYMTNDVPVQGFQLQIGFNCGYNQGGYPLIPCNDECCSLNILSASGGEIVPDGWLTSGNSNWNNIVGYSLSPDLLIPAGEGHLLTISFTDYNDFEICISTFDSNTPSLSLPQIIGSELNIISTTVGSCIACDIDDADICGICDGDGTSCSGCTDPNASNYDENATFDDDSCEYDDNWVYGCTYDTATNFNSEATFDDGSCDFKWGDVNQDGQLTIQDIILIVNEILSF